MSSQTEQSPSERSPFVRFLDAFLQEENIKWILGLGVCILLGSSLRLVTTHWHECTPVWKYLILIGYTGVVFALGEFGYHRLGLRKTGTVLKALTVLLIPLSFLALHWVRPQGTDAGLDWLKSTELTLMLGVNLVWSAYAAHRIIRHFLRQTQTTFLVSYLTLCVAGAVVPGLPVAWAPVLALALWAVFAAGTVKVNRHVFWLTEEHRLPRIFGFFPISLLGTQFAAVFLLGLANHITTAWMGLLCTLIALPILLTADAVARVFERRTGGLVRPIPWSISGPLLLGTILCAAGVVLALTGWPASPAVVPTAILAAVAMGVVAQRTQKSAFVWGMVFCIMAAYQTSPVLFKEQALQLRDQAAAAVNQPRLPYAFYGLTYAPLIVTFSLVASRLQRRGQLLFAGPLRQMASVLPWILFGVSFTHSSAVLPVSLVLCPLFAGQAYLFRQRMLLIPAALAFLAAAYGTPGYCHLVWQFELSTDTALLIWTSAAGLLFVPGYWVDRWSRSLPWYSEDTSSTTGPQSICQLFSLAATIAAGWICIVRLSQHSVAWKFGPTELSTLLIGTLLASHALRWLKPGLGEMSLAFGSFVILKHVLPDAGTWETRTNIVGGLMLGQWLLSYGLERIPQSRITRAFGRPAVHVSFVGLSVLFGSCALTWFACHAGLGHVSWAISACLLLWALDASRRLKSSIFAAIAWSSLFVFGSAAITAIYGSQIATPWWMAVWATIGLGLLLLRQILISTRRLQEDFDFHKADTTSEFCRQIETWLSPLAVILPTMFLMIAAASLLFLGWPQRCAGVLALAGLWTAHHSRLDIKVSAVFWPLVNWQLLAMVATACLASGKLVLELTPAELMACGLPLSACAALSAWCFQSQRVRDRIQHAEVMILHELALVMLCLLLLAGALSWNVAGTWSAVDLGWAALTWFSFTAVLFTSAVRTQERERVWGGLAALLGAFLYFALMGAWDLSNPALAYLYLATGLALWSSGRYFRHWTRLAVLAGPFQQSGFWLPAIVVPFAIWLHLGEYESAWAGANGLPLLGAATFYFWRGLEDRQLGTTLLSAMILNIAGALLWSELHWTDPQLFLMPIGISILMLTELMQREIPTKYHDRLRLIGALVILVSPVFHIVTGSWLHLVTLMIASVAVALLAIGLRIRVLLYTGTAFLLADLVALIARGSIDQPNLLWIVGVVIGGLVIALGAICENHRETLLSRLRGMAAALEQWS